MIQVTNPNSKMPKALKLISKISTYLFEEQYGECQYLKDSEKEAINKAIRALSRASYRTCKAK